MERTRIAWRRRFNLSTKNRRLLPRVSIHRGNKITYLQLIDDVRAVTLLSDSDRGLEGTRSERAKVLGRRFAESFLSLGFSEAVYDTSWYRYHGIVKACLDSFQETVRVRNSQD